MGNEDEISDVVGEIYWRQNWRIQELHTLIARGLSRYLTKSYTESSAIPIRLPIHLRDATTLPAFAASRLFLANVSGKTYPLR